MTEKSTFEILNKIDVTERIEKKNGLSYLSWAWALTELKKIYPEAILKVYETSDGMNYWNDGKTAWVKTSCTINGKEETDYLPVMDFKNKSIPLKDVTSVDVNKTLKRSITKAMGYHGLGLYIYAGEDLPETDEGVSAYSGKKKEGVTSASIKKQWVAIKKDIEAASTLKELQQVWTSHGPALKDMKEFDEQSYDVLEGAKDAAKELLSKDDLNDFIPV